MRIDTHRHNAFWDEWRSEVRMEGTLTTTITTTINKPSPTAVDNHSWYCNHFFNCSQSFSYSTVKVWVLGGPIPRSVDLPDYWNIENKWIPNPVETRYRWTMLHYGVRWWITTTTTRNNLTVYAISWLLWRYILVNWNGPSQIPQVCSVVPFKGGGPGQPLWVLLSGSRARDRTWRMIVGSD